MIQTDQIYRYIFKFVLAGFLLFSSVGLYADDVAGDQLEKYQEIQKVCARAVEEPLSRTDIPGLRECISLLDGFAVYYRSSPLTNKINNDLPIVPRVDWFAELIPILDGQFVTDGRVNNEPVEVIIRPEAVRTRISQDLVANLILKRGIKLRVREESVEKEYITTSINDIQIGSLRFQNIVALIDPALEPDQLVIGTNVLRGLHVEDSGQLLAISGGVIQEGSEDGLGISLPVINSLLDQLINELVVSFEKRMSKIKRTLELASEIDDIDEYGIKLGLLEDVRKEVNTTTKSYPEIYDSQRSKIEETLGNVRQLVDETIKKREKFAKKFCMKIRQTSSLVSISDDVNQLIVELEHAYQLLGRLEDHFKGTKLVSDLLSSLSHCGISANQLSVELDIADQYLAAMFCIDTGLATTIYIDRENAFDCALRILLDIEAESKNSALATRVKNGSGLGGFAKSKLKGLIKIEDEAQDRLANAEELREEASGEDRLPRRYEILTDAMDELEIIQTLNAAVDPAFLERAIKEISAELADLEELMPIEPELVSIDSGCFTIGAITGDVDAADDEGQREVCVEKFQMSIYEVTFDEFDRYSNLEYKRQVDDRGWGRGIKPVINVSYMEAIAYTEWLSYHTGYTYRLPTEAEWEYAARGGQETIFPWGNRVGRNKANCRNCRSEWGGKKTAPVGSFEPNGYGIYDMAGNVAERTCSIYRARYDGSERLCQPIDAAGDRAVRGGSWKSHSRNVRSSYRYAAKEIDKKSRFRGFRLVQEYQ